MIDYNNRTKILYIADALSPGGAERRLIQLLKHLNRNTFTRRLVLLSDIIHYDEIYDLDLEISILNRGIKKDFSIFFKLLKICRDWKPDIIHAWGSMPASYTGPVAKSLGIKMINAMIADAPNRLTRKQKLRSFWSFPFSQIIQANSYTGLKAYGVPAKKGNVVHNGFDFSRIENLKDRQKVREELNISTAFVAGMVAGFRYHKDHDSLIEAALQIISVRNDVTFVCVGDGPEIHRIKKKSGGNDRIIFTGKRSDVESLVNVFDIGILLTNLDRHGEGISNSIMEYMALGKPVIATDGGGTPEIVLDGETGYLVPQKSPLVLAEKIEFLLDNEELRESMGIEGKERILGKFSIDSMIDGHASLYRSLTTNY